MKGIVYTLSTVIMFSSLLLLSNALLDHSLEKEGHLTRQIASLNTYFLSQDLVSQLEDCLDLKFRVEDRALFINQHIEEGINLEENIMRMEGFWQELERIEWDIEEVKNDLPAVEYTIEPSRNNITWKSSMPRLELDLESSDSLSAKFQFNASCSSMWNCSPGDCTFPAGGYNVSLIGCGSDSVELNTSQAYTYTMATGEGNITLSIEPLEKLVLDYSLMSAPVSEEIKLLFEESVERIGFRNAKAHLNISTAFQISKETELFFGD